MLNSLTPILLLYILNEMHPVSLGLFILVWVVYVFDIMFRVAEYGRKVEASKKKEGS